MLSKYIKKDIYKYCSFFNEFLRITTRLKGLETGGP